MATAAVLRPSWADGANAPLTGPRVLAVVGEVDPITTVWRVLWPVSELKRRGYPAGGLLADGVDAWEHHLSRLIESRDERHDRVRTLQRWVMAEHTLQANASRWVEAWRSIVASGPRRSLPSGGQAAADRARQKAKAKAKRRR